MKVFHLEPGMLTMRGVFYPTGYMVLMFPGEAEAVAAEEALLEHGVTEDQVCHLDPEVIHREIVRTVGNADIPLPSPGTEADTVRRYAELASQGHHALLVHAPSGKETEHVMDLLKGHPISYGQKYRQLVIEDLVN